MGRKRRQQRKGKRQRRPATEAKRDRDREPVDERRGIVVEATAMGGVPLEEAHVLVVIEPIRLPSGDDLYFQSPFVVPFYLLKGKALRDAAEPRRARALSETTRTEDGTLRPLDPGSVLDALEDLALAVIIAAAAIEAHATT